MAPQLLEAGLRRRRHDKVDDERGECKEATRGTCTAAADLSVRHLRAAGESHAQNTALAAHLRPSRARLHRSATGPSPGPERALLTSFRSLLLMRRSDTAFGAPARAPAARGDCYPSSARWRCPLLAWPVRGRSRAHVGCWRRLGAGSGPSHRAATGCMHGLACGGRARERFAPARENWCAHGKTAAKIRHGA